MKACFRRILIPLLACNLSIPRLAHGQQRQGQTDERIDLEHTSWPVAGMVRTALGDPVHGATVIVAPLDNGPSRSVTTNAMGQFRTKYVLNVRRVAKFDVILTATKKGFQTAHAYVNYDTSDKPREVSLTLRGMDEDPDLLSATDLVADLAPRLRQLGPAEGLDEKSGNDYARGVVDFLDHNDLEHAIPLLSQVVERNPTCVGCRTMLGLAQLAWCDWDNGRDTLAESVNASRDHQAMERPEPLLAYGSWLTWQHQPEKAVPIFQEALSFAPQDPLALQEFGRALLLAQQAEAAKGVLKGALAAGAGTEARLLYVESCLRMGRSDEAAAEMDRLLGGRDVKDMPIRVRQAYESVQEQRKVEGLYAKNQPASSTANEAEKDRSDFVPHPSPDLIYGLEPAKDQEALSTILDGVGLQILELMKNFPNTMSLEAIHQVKLTREGKVRNEQNQKFHYLVLVPHDSFGPRFAEYRTDLSGIEASPMGLHQGFMLTQGFASVELLFHPAYRSDSTFRYLGRQNVDGRNTFVVAYAQIPGKTRFHGTFRTGTTTVTTLWQGLAWIDPDSYRILRLHTDLLAPLPELRLDRETLNIDFNEIHFATLKESVWLPKEVTVTLDWRGGVLRNQHEYSDFKIFNVDVLEKIGKPKDSAESSAP